MPTSFLEDLKPLMSRPDLHLVNWQSSTACRKAAVLYKVFPSTFASTSTISWSCYLQTQPTSVEKMILNSFRLAYLPVKTSFCMGEAGILQNYFLLPVILKLEWEMVFLQLFQMFALWPFEVVLLYLLQCYILLELFLIPKALAIFFLSPYLLTKSR